MIDGGRISRVAATAIAAVAAAFGGARIAGGQEALVTPPADQAATRPATTPATLPAFTEDGGVTVPPEPPATLEELQARLELARQQMEALGPYAQPATQPAADEALARLNETRSGLYRAWEAYATQLQRLATLREVVPALSDEARIQEVAAKIEELERLKGEIEALPPPIRASDEQVAEVTARYDEARAELAAAMDRQSARATQLATGFRQQRDSLNAELEQARAERQNLESVQPATASAPADLERIELERDRLGVKIARLNVALRVLDLEQQQAEVLTKQATPRIEARRQYVITLGRRLGALTEARSRSRLDAIAMQLRQATKPHEIAVLEMQQFGERVLAEYFETAELRRMIQGRFSEIAESRLTTRVETSEALWKNTAETLNYRTGKETLALRADLQQDRREFEAELADLSGRLTEVSSRLHQLLAVRDRTLSRLTEYEDRVSAEIKALDAAERTRLETEKRDVAGRLTKIMGEKLADLRKVRDRLQEAVEAVQGHVAFLSQLGENVYWSALLRRESGLVGVDWGGAQAEMVRLLELDRGSEEPQRSRQRLLLTEDDRADLRERIAGVGADLAAVSTRGWLQGILPLLAGVAAAWLVTRWGGRRVKVLHERQSAASEEENAARRARERIDLLGSALLRDLAWPVALGGAIWLALRTAGVPADTRAPFVALLLVVVGVYALLRFVRISFRPDRYRVFQCRSYVARHYRWWFTVLLVFSVIVLAPLAFLTALDVAPKTRTLLLEVFKTGALLLVFGFLVRRNRVIGPTHADDHKSKAILVSLYPLAVLAVISLLVMEVVGYGLLVGFVISRAAISFAIIVAAIFVLDHVAEWFDRPEAPPPDDEEVSGDRAAPGLSREQPDGRPVGDRSSTGLPSAAASSRFSIDEEEEHAPRTYLMRLLRALLLIAGAGAAMALVLELWGATFYRAWLTGRFLGFTALIVGVALVVDRLVSTAMRALEVSGRLPESTVSMILRWVRGLIALFVVLGLAALADLPIQYIWTPLATVLGMIAIGFVAVWSMLSNILATFMILIWRPFNVGERIEIQPEGISGDVVDINFMFTLLAPDPGTRIAVPNSMFLQKFIKRQRIRSRPKKSLAEQLAAETPINEPEPAKAAEPAGSKG